MAIFDDKGNIVEIRSVGRDVTDCKEAKDALRRSELYFRSLLFGMHEDILVIDRTFIITDVNKDFLATLGKRRDEVVGRYCYDITHGYSEPCKEHGEDCVLLEVFETGKAHNARHGHTHTDGSKRWVDILFSPLKDENGTVTHVIEAIRDMTHEIELERQFRQTQKMEAIGTLAGGIAHDFNNILGIILGYSEMILFDAPEESQLRTHLMQIIKASHRAKDLVMQILAFSRHKEQELRPLRVGSLMKEVVKLLRAALPSTIDIRLKIEDGLQDGDTILGDPTQIHQVLMNLCTNAGHSMQDRGGTLELDLCAVEFDQNDIGRPVDLHPGPYVHLTVRDTGHGMDQATSERIFEPYFTTKVLGEGTGLGLSVVHGIVKSHGGAITFSSELGKGTSFHVFFPRSEREVKSEVEFNLGGIPMGKESILFVDDEEPLTQWGKKMLERFGYKAVAKTSSIEALEAFRAQPDRFDLVITDHTMPHMTGMELAKELMSIRPDIPIILCTGFGELLDPEEVKAMGIREFVPKPLVVQQIAGIIRRILDSSSPS